MKMIRRSFWELSVFVAIAVRVTVAFAVDARCGRVALHTWLTAAEFKDISVTGADGATLWRGLPDPATCEVGSEGSWTREGDVIRQSNARACNSPLDREALKEASGVAKVVEGSVVEMLPPLSLTVFRIGNQR